MPDQSTRSITVVFNQDSLSFLNFVVKNKKGGGEGRGLLTFFPRRGIRGGGGVDRGFTAYWGDRDGPALKLPASHQCNPGSSPIVDATCGLSSLLVHFFLSIFQFSPLPKN